MIHLISVFSDGAQDAVSISSMINPENKLECESSSESGTFSVDSIIEGPTKWKTLTCTNLPSNWIGSVF